MYRVLLADDEPLVLDTLSAIIPWAELDCELIGTALNGMDSYNKICDDYPDIVITDIRMPLLNGLELIERAVKLDKNIDFILLSGYDDFSFAQKAMQFGVKYYHLKPARKEEMIQTLQKVILERSKRDAQKEIEQQQLLSALQLPLQKSFLYDALHQSPLTDQTLRHYIQLLGIPQDAAVCCICTFLEERCLTQFQKELHEYTRRHRLLINWPAFYVTNSLLFSLQATDLDSENSLSTFVQSRHFPGQKVDLECHFLYFRDSIQMYHEIFRKISRYHTIWLVNGINAPEAVNNMAFSGQSTGFLSEELKQLSSVYEADRLLNELFASVENVEAAILLSIRLLFSCTELSEKADLDPYTLKRLFASTSVKEVHNITINLFSQQFEDFGDNSAKNSLIPRVKAYVENHLDSETLSLKWLAENQFYISVGYLSKQFLAEEGEHFSSYLSRQRVELAKKLMNVYHNDNIQDIAQKAGFRNNPKYFGQVFKKVTGQTPSEYLIHLKGKEISHNPSHTA